MKPRKTWREKLADHKGLPKVATIAGRMSKRWGTGKMVIPAPLEVDLLRASAAAADRAIRHAISQARVGCSLDDIAASAFYQLRVDGCESAIVLTWLMNIKVFIQLDEIRRSDLWQQQLPQDWQPVQLLAGLSHMWIGTHWLPLGV